jgi:hypothetical protein
MYKFLTVCTIDLDLHSFFITKMRREKIAEKGKICARFSFIISLINCEGEEGG